MMFVMDSATALLEFFNLKEKPFVLLPNPRFFYMSEAYLETKSKLLYFLKDKSASLYLFGPIGTGKSSLLRLIANEIDADKQTLAKYIISPNLKTSNQMLRLICDEFGVKTERAYGASLKNFEKFLIKKAKEGITPLLLIDEGQNLTYDELKLVHYLLNYVSNEKVLLMIVLVGQPELGERISRFPSLRSRMISSSISEMTREDAEQMIRFRWQVAGVSENPFLPESYDEIYRLTKGNPREIVKLCNAALLIGFLKKQRKIGPEIIKKASKEL